MFKMTIVRSNMTEEITQLDKRDPRFRRRRFNTMDLLIRGEPPQARFIQEFAEVRPTGTWITATTATPQFRQEFNVVMEPGFVATAVAPTPRRRAEVAMPPEPEPTPWQDFGLDIDDMRRIERQHIETTTTRRRR